jgi:hypothetical protein
MQARHSSCSQRQDFITGAIGMEAAASTHGASANEKKIWERLAGIPPSIEEEVGIGQVEGGSRYSSLTNSLRSEEAVIASFFS